MKQPRRQAFNDNYSPGLGLSGGDGGGTFDGMESRVAKLEANFGNAERLLGEVRADLRADVRDLRDRMAKLEVKVDHLPSKGFIFTVASGLVAFMVAVATLAPKLQQWFGLAH